MSGHTFEATAYYMLILCDVSVACVIPLFVCDVQFYSVWFVHFEWPDWFGRPGHWMLYGYDSWINVYQHLYLYVIDVLCICNVCMDMCIWWKGMLLTNVSTVDTGK